MRLSISARVSIACTSVIVMALALLAIGLSVGNKIHQADLRITSLSDALGREDRLDQAQRRLGPRFVSRLPFVEQRLETQVWTPPRIRDSRAVTAEAYPVRTSVAPGRRASGPMFPPRTGGVLRRASSRILRSRARSRSWPRRDPWSAAKPSPRPCLRRPTGVPRGPPA